MCPDSPHKSHAELDALVDKFAIELCPVCRRGRRVLRLETSVEKFSRPNSLPARAETLNGIFIVFPLVIEQVC